MADRETGARLRAGIEVEERAVAEAVAVELLALRPEIGLTGLLRPTKELSDLIEVAPIAPIRAAATKRADGRRVPLVFVMVTDAHGRTRRGIPVRLVGDDTRIIDRALTDKAGIALLRFQPRDGGDVAGKVVVATENPVDVTVPAARQAEVIEVVVADLGTDALVDGVVIELAEVIEELAGATVASATEGTTSSGGASPAVADIDPASLLALVEQVVLSTAGGGAGGDVFTRLPTDVSTQVCDVLGRISPERPDPLLGDALTRAGLGSGASVGGSTAGGSTGAAALVRRAPLIRTLTVQRVVTDDGNPVAGSATRYAVRLRQRWVFTGYSLGELAKIDALDPGAVVRDVTSAVSRTVQNVERFTETAANRATSLVLSQLKQVSTVDNVVRATTDTTSRTGVDASVGADPLAVGVGAVLGGLAFGPVGMIGGGLLGALAGGVDAGVGASTGVSVNAVTTTNLSTVLDVNQVTRTTASALNNLSRTASSALEELQRTTGQTLDRISPLLSRVTNLLRWTMYENWLVCTEVEDVLKVHEVKAFASVPNKKKPGISIGGLLADHILDQLGDLLDEERPAIFTPKDVVDYRRLFAPALLDARLAARYDELERIVSGDDRRVIRRIGIRVDYLALGASAILRFNVGANEVAIRLRPGDATATATLLLPPVDVDDLGQAMVTLTLLDEDGRAVDRIVRAGSASPPVVVQAIHLWFDRPSSARPDQTLVDSGLPVPSSQTVTVIGLRLTIENGFTVGAAVDLVPLPAEVVDPKQHPLVRHVNANQTHYLSTLANAALAEPSLRDDSRHLRQIAGGRGSEAALWKLPILGIEAGKILVLGDPGDDPVAKRLLDEPGAATIVQLAAPGAYAEALQGLLSLVDAEKLLHPALLAPPSPLLAPAALINTEDGTIVPMETSVVPIPGTSPTSPIGTPLDGLVPVPSIP